MMLTIYLGLKFYCPKDRSLVLPPRTDLEPEFENVKANYVTVYHCFGGLCLFYGSSCCIMPEGKAQEHYPAMQSVTET